MPQRYVISTDSRGNHSTVYYRTHEMIKKPCDANSFDKRRARSSNAQKKNVDEFLGVLGAKILSNCSLEECVQYVADFHGELSMGGPTPDDLIGQWLFDHEGEQAEIDRVLSRLNQLGFRTMQDLVDREIPDETLKSFSARDCERATDLISLAMKMRQGHLD